jgi:serine protease AprX
MQETHVPDAFIPGGCSDVRKRFVSIPVALTAALLAGTLLSGAAVAAPSAARSLDKSVRVHPKLQYGAQVEPNKKVRVLVQKKSPSVDARAIAGKGKAALREEFSQFSTSSMEILQKDIAQLAKDPGVLFISPDGSLSGKKKSDDVDKDNEGQDDEWRQEAALKLLAATGPRKVRATGALPNDDDLLTTYPQDVNAPTVWSRDKGGLTGAGVTVAVLDTGVNPFHRDLDGKVFPVFVNPKATGYLDELGHGTHVTGIINGRDDYDQYVGIAPNARVISVKIADDRGAALESDMLRGMQWVYENHARYNIRVVNLSLAAATAQSYKSSPIDAAVERLWQAGVTVVASAGNRGNVKGASWYAPGNDPFAITVGCLDDNQTLKSDDDSVCSFGSRGKTQDGIAKPDIVAPGRKIVAPLAAAGAELAIKYPDRVTPDGKHIRLSGTSMAAPVATGAIALMLQKYPNLKPNQIKWVLMDTARSYKGQPDKAGLLDIAKAVEKAGGTLKEANLGLKLSQALSIGTGQNVGQTSAYWDSAYWDSAYWDSAYWDSAYWDSAYWDSAGVID